MVIDFIGGTEAYAATIPSNLSFEEELDQQIPIRGLTYSPIPKGGDRRDGIDWNAHIGDISLLKQMGINTIRTYYPITSEDFLNELEAQGIKVIIGFPSFDDRHVRGPDIRRGSYARYIENQE